MRLFDTPGADHIYNKWFDPPTRHSDEFTECGCESCHELHMDEGLMEELSKTHECCKDELDYQIRNGQWCRNHGSPSMDDNGDCLECAYIRRKNRLADLYDYFLNAIETVKRKLGSLSGFDKGGS